MTLLRRAWITQAIFSPIFCLWISMILVHSNKMKTCFQWHLLNAWTSHVCATEVLPLESQGSHRKYWECWDYFWGGGLCNFSNFFFTGESNLITIQWNTEWLSWLLTPLKDLGEIIFDIVSKTVILQLSKNRKHLCSRTDVWT